MTWYATLSDSKGAQNATLTTDDAVFLNNARVVSRRIDRLMGGQQRPFFAPYKEQHQIVLDGMRVNTNQNTFLLDRPLLAMTAITLAGTTLVIDTDVELWPTLRSPAYQLRLKNRRKSWYDYCDSNNTPAIVQITGTWGWNRDWANAFLDVTTLGAAIANTTTTSITLTDVDGVDVYGRTPWISAGAMLQIDDEWLHVTATDTVANTATVIRGVNGSTAAIHDNGATVSVYQVEEDVRDVVARQAAFKYSRRGAWETAQITDLGTVQFPSDLLAELRGVLTGYAYE